jgi:rhodanese-related sulfurtransferase
VSTAVSPDQLRARLLDEEELALIDVRETQPYSESHLLWAVPLPLGRLEPRVAGMIPRRDVRIVCCDGGEGLAERAALRLAELGYPNAGFLAGGTPAWAKAGHELFSGVNVPSKAFGEFVEREAGTPSVSADELRAMLDRGDNVTVLDSRPSEEFNHVSIPTGVCCPGAELVYRVHDAAPDPETTVLVNCAGRTRSIIGAQSLIDAGVPNKVVALRNGTMGWQLAGHEPAHGETRHADSPSPAGLAKGRAAAERVAERCGIRTIDLATLEAWTKEAEQRALYLLDVRTREEFEAGHLSGSVHAPGGQLVQNTDSWIAIRNARIVLVDADGVRATMTAGWLSQMGHHGTVVLEGGLSGSLETGKAPVDIPGLDADEIDFVSPTELTSLARDPGTVIVDLSLSPFYRMGHIEGAWYATRARIEQALARVPRAEVLVLISTDGVIASLAAREVRAIREGPVRVLEGGNKAWKNAGLPLVSEPVKMADETDDFWQIPYDANRSDGKTVKQAMEDYLSWEVELDRQIERDGTTRFSRSG